MPGRLRSCWSEWEKLKPNSLVRSIILRGYRLEWRDGAPPPPITRTNSAKAYEHHEFVTKKVQEVKQSGVVRTCRRDDLICILSINVLPKPKSDKLRLIIDGSPLKPYELRRRFKLEQIWKEGREIFAGCTHGSVIDISNAFFHIDIAEESKQYLGFEWGGEYYQFNPSVLVYLPSTEIRRKRSRKFI